VGARVTSTGTNFGATQGTVTRAKTAVALGERLIKYSLASKKRETGFVESVVVDIRFATPAATF
jgi:hypothetical protein